MAEDNRAPADLNAAENVALARADLGAARYNFGAIQTATDNNTPDMTAGNGNEPMADHEIPMGNVRNIPTLEVPVTLQQTRGYDASTRDPECGICLEEMSQNDATYMHIGCTNYFHSGCYERAMRESLNCPKCRAPLRSYSLYAALEGVESLSFAERVAPDMDAEVRNRIVLDDPGYATPEQLLNLRQQSRPIVADALEEYELDKNELQYWTERKAKQVKLGEAFNDVAGYEAQEQYHKDCLDAMDRYHHELLDSCTSLMQSTRRTFENHMRPLIQQRYKAHYHIHTHTSGQSRTQAESQYNIIDEQERTRLTAEHEAGKLNATQEYAQARETIMQMAMRDCTDHRRTFHRGLLGVASAFEEELDAARARMRDACKNSPVRAAWEPYPPDPRDTGLVESRETMKERQGNLQPYDAVQPVPTPEEELSIDTIPYGPTAGGILLSGDTPEAGT